MGTVLQQLHSWEAVLALRYAAQRDAAGGIQPASIFDTARDTYLQYQGWGE